VKVKNRDQIYYLAKGALTCNRLEEDFKRGNWVEGVPKLKSVAQVFKEKGGYEIVGELKGSEMIGWTYDGPFDEVPAQGQPFGYPAEIAHVVNRQKWSPAVSSKDAHRVIEWNLGETEGTGIVHIAPGCGKEDFELGKSLGLPPIAPLDDAGNFLPDFGPLAGKSAFANGTLDQILESLTQKGVLTAVERYPHNYPHCWRCKTELLFRLVDEWYISMGREDDPGSYRRQIMRVTEDVTFLPESINGKARELDWLKNMGDWMISKKRYWGLALPIWVCDSESCGAFEVIGDRAELQQRAVSGWEKFDGHPPHRPWVDLVMIRCAKCGGTASRISDVGNPWLDAGIVPYSTMGYNTDRSHWEKWFPADFITECFPGQFRNWFYAILAMSTMMENRAPFRVLLGHALVRDEKGEEMHKAKGNAIWFDDGAEKMGVDVMRWLYCRQNPTQNLMFGYGPGREVERQVFNTLWNCYAFFVNYAILDEFDPLTPAIPVAGRAEIDRWILSNLQLLVRDARKNFESFNTTGVVRAAEDFIEDLSNWYIRRTRRRFWRSRGEDDRDKIAAYQTLHAVLVTLCKVIAPIVPFLTERIYQNLVRSSSADSTQFSVHLADFPEVNTALIDESLSFRMGVAKQVVATGHALREQAKQRVRQPIAEIRVAATDPQQRDAVERLAPVILEELNIKRLTIVESLGDLTSVTAKPNFAVLGPRYGKDVPKIAAALVAASAELLGKLQAGESIAIAVEERNIDLTPADVNIQVSTKTGWFVGDAGSVQVAIDAAVTPELAREGLARDVVRQIQQYRKDLKLEIQDRIAVTFHTDDPELLRAITEWESYIKQETLCDSLVAGPPDDSGRWVELGDRKLWLKVRKV
jgi:isoleucyl-tRNA synthetase